MGEWCVLYTGILSAILLGRDDEGSIHLACGLVIVVGGVGSGGEMRLGRGGEVLGRLLTQADLSQ